jgi:hypothetical protein
MTYFIASFDLRNLYLILHKQLLQHKSLFSNMPTAPYLFCFCKHFRDCRGANFQACVALPTPLPPWNQIKYNA